MINRNFLDKCEIREAINAGGAKALGIIVELSVYLKGASYAVGKINDLKRVASECKMNIRSLRRWMVESDMFVLDDERGVFFFPLLRHMLGLDDCPSEEELDFVRKNGNRFRPRNEEKHSEKQLSDDEKTAGNNRENTAKLRNSSEIVEKKLKNSLEKVEKSSSQSTDNQDVGKPLIVIDNTNTNTIISLQGSENNNKNTNISTSGDFREDENADGIFKDFEENLIKAAPWRESVSQSLCINISDKDNAEIFAKWMCFYCRGRGKMPKKWKEQKNYAFFLLMKNRDTRRAFEAYLKKQLHERQLIEQQRRNEELDDEEAYSRPNYEHKKNGHRYASNGEILPRNAPAQPNAQMRWSYRQNKWVEPEGYDFRDEWNYELRVLKKRHEAARAASLKDRKAGAIC